MLHRCPLQFQPCSCCEPEQRQVLRDTGGGGVHLSKSRTVTQWLMAVAQTPGLCSTVTLHSQKEETTCHLASEQCLVRWSPPELPVTSANRKLPDGDGARLENSLVSDRKHLDDLRVPALSGDSLANFLVESVAHLNAGCCSSAPHLAQTWLTCPTCR